MKLKNETYTNGCTHCGSGKTIAKKAVYGCDCCKSEIKTPKNNGCDYLSITVFYNGDRESETFEFCSWICVFKFLSKIQRTKYKSDYFISMPYIHFDTKMIGYKDFMKALKSQNAIVIQDQKVNTINK